MIYMGISGIFNRFNNKNTDQNKNYLSLTLTFDSVLASVWTFEDDQVHILGFAKKPFQSVESLIHQAAVAIDTAAEKAGSDFSQVVFGLSSNWFENQEPTIDASKLLKKLSEDLELDAQAFVPLSSSIKNFLKIKDSSLPTVVLLGVFGDYFELHLVRNDQVDKTLIYKSKPTLEKISSLVKELGDPESLPSKILIYGLPQDSKLTEEIQKAQFKEVFIQQPNIEFIKDDELSYAVAISQGTDILGHEPKSMQSASINTLSKQTTDSNELKAHIPQKDELGFVEGEDILQITENSQKQTDIAEKLDLAEKTPTAPHESFESFHPESKKTIIADNKPQDNFPKERSANLIDKITTLTWMSKFLELFKGGNLLKKVAMALGVILIFALLGLFILGKTQTSAEVVIKINSHTQEDNFDVDVIQGKSSNYERQEIAGFKVEGQASGARKAVATGKEKVGEFAKGEVTVFNWTSNPKKFTEGSMIITKNGLKFKIDQAIEATSAAAPSGSNPGSPGKAQVKVTADNVGKEYNVETGQQFTFVQFDEFSYSAQNDAPFSGGDEKEVTVVSQDDLDKLERSLLESLKENAIGDLKNNLSGKKYHDEAIQTAIDKKTFDKKLDEESSLVNLDLVVTASAIVYDESQLKELLAQNAKSSTPQNLESKSENIEIISIDAKTTNHGLNISGKFRAQFVPKFDQDELKEKIAKKSVKQTKEIILKLPEVVDLKVNFSPSFNLTNTIPTNKEKITFKFET